MASADPTIGSSRDVRLEDQRWPAQFYGDAFSDQLTALRVLRLLFRSKDWVHRRVETVKFRDDTAVSRRVTVDFTIPLQAPRLQTQDGNILCLIPLTLLRKKSLVNFDLRDHCDQALTHLGLRQNQALTSTVLETWVEVLLDRQLREEDDADRDLKRDIRHIVAGDQAQLQRALSRLDDSEINQDHKTLRKNPFFQVVMHQFANGFMLVVCLETNGPLRRIVKFSYDEPLTFRYGGHEGIRRSALSATARFGWSPAKVRFPTPSVVDTQSYHFEIHAPTGLNVTKASLIAGCPYDENTAASFDRVPGGSPTVDLHVAEVPVGSVGQAKASFVVRPESWLGLPVLGAWLTATVLTSGALWLRSLSATSGDIAAPLLLALTGIVATMLARPIGHGMATRLLSGARMLAMTSALLPFVAVGTLAVDNVSQAQQYLWWAMAAAALVIALALSIHYVRSRASFDITSPWEQGEGIEPPPDQGSTYSVLAAKYRLEEPAIEVTSSESGRFKFEERRKTYRLLYLQKWSADLQSNMLSVLDSAIRIRER